MSNTNVTITADDSIISMFVEASCALYGYNASTGQTPGAFAQDQLIKFCKDVIKSYQIREETRKASDAIASQIGTLLDNASVAITVEPVSQSSPDPTPSPASDPTPSPALNSAPLKEKK